MKCPKCDITLPEDIEVCPLCHTPLGGAIKETEENLRRLNVLQVRIQDVLRLLTLQRIAMTLTFNIP